MAEEVFEGGIQAGSVSTGSWLKAAAESATVSRLTVALGSRLTVKLGSSTTGGVTTVNGVPSTGQKLNLSANSSLHTEQNFIDTTSLPAPENSLSKLVLIARREVPKAVARPSV